LRSSWLEILKAKKSGEEDLKIYECHTCHSWLFVLPSFSHKNSYATGNEITVFTDYKKQATQSHEGNDNKGKDVNRNMP
jgi:hypothetical protein